ncbi:MAG TPA: hypothetical protein ENK10_03570 [Acidobacteria bacterium]|nr:hypothetical protein [Acidobacteriota bacterium]
MGPRLLPLLRFACLLVATSSSVWAGAPGQQRQPPAPARWVPQDSEATLASAPAHLFEATTRFDVRASRLGLSARRSIDVTARLEGLRGRIDVRLDRPIRSILGIRQVELEVQIIDSRGSVISRLRGVVPAGQRSFSLPLVLAAPGRYTLRLEDSGLRAGKARVRVQPSGSASLDIIATRTGE